MAQRSLRDEMLSGRAPRGGRRRRVPVALLAVVGAVAVLVLIGQLMPHEQGGSGVPPAGPGAASAFSSPSGTPSPAGSGQPASGVSSAQSAVAADILDQLAGIPVTEDAAVGDYDRGYFGQAWFDADRNGCDTRNDILRRDLHDLRMKADTAGCKVLGGVLDDWYSGTTVQFASGGGGARMVQIDHVVPLSWAWQHGAPSWDDESRRDFANDPLNLVATTEQQNSSKGDSGPAEWLPASDAAQCRYAQRFTAVLVGHGLSIDLRDRAMLRGVLEECAASSRFGAFDSQADLAALVADASRRAE